MTDTNTAAALSVELAPCPFCGNDVATQGFWYGAAAGDEPSGYHVFCLECSETDTLDGPRRDTLNEAIAAWNTRVATPAPAALEGSSLGEGECVRFHPDVFQWQTDQSEWFQANILEIVSEYADWRDRRDVALSERWIELEAIARAATPGPWAWDEEVSPFYNDPDGRSCGGEATGLAEVFRDGDEDTSIVDRARLCDAAFIAAANPATVLDLIAQVRALQPSSAADAKPVAWPTEEAVARKLATIKGHRDLEHEIVCDDQVARPVWQIYLPDAREVIALYAQPHPSQQEGERVSAYVAEYEFRGDGGDYSPNEGERLLIEDAIHGFLASREG